jgi:hypothetical protein
MMKPTTKNISMEHLLKRAMRVKLLDRDNYQGFGSGARAIIG